VAIALIVSVTLAAIAAVYATLCEVIERLYPQHLSEFIVSVRTGMRRGELYSAEWGQFSMERRTIELGKVKGDNARRRGRTVRLTKDAAALLDSLRKPGQKSTDRIFPRIGAQDNRFWFTPCLKEAGIDDYVWHSNRHSFCSWLAMAGASQRDIMELAGHKTIRQAARYSHLSPDHQISVLDRI